MNITPSPRDVYHADLKKLQDVVDTLKMVPDEKVDLALWKSGWVDINGACKTAACAAGHYVTRFPRRGLSFDKSCSPHDTHDFSCDIFGYETDGCDAIAREFQLDERTASDLFANLWDYDEPRRGESSRRFAIRMFAAFIEETQRRRDYDHGKGHKPPERTTWDDD